LEGLGCCESGAKLLKMLRAGALGNLAPLFVLSSLLFDIDRYLKRYVGGLVVSTI
jgi:hypothetical protein